MDLERLLGEINGDLEVAEARILEAQKGQPLAFPLVLVLGPPRCGTTLFMQWLAGTGLFAYPTNFLSRFYNAPIIGAKIQLMLADRRYRFRDEFEDFSGPADFSSENGKTKGLLAPNEFWYFWRRFLPDPIRDVWTDEELLESRGAETMKAELNGIMDVFRRPFAAKGMLFNYNVAYLDDVLEKAVFVHVERDRVQNVASILKARERQYGDRAPWYSFEIPEFGELRELDPIHQVAGQVTYIHSALERALARVDSTRKLKVSYEKFCANPLAVFEELTALIGIHDATYVGPSQFEESKAEVPEAEEIRDALLRLR